MYIMNMENVVFLDSEIKELLSLYDEKEIAYYKEIVTECNSHIEGEYVSVNAIYNKEGTDV